MFETVRSETVPSAVSDKKALIVGDASCQFFRRPPHAAFLIFVRD